MHRAYCTKAAAVTARRLRRTVVSTDQHSSHCGACNQACTIANGTAECLGGECRVASCNTGFSDCNQDASDGCEVNLLEDANNCGACTAACSVTNGTPACALGQCRIDSCDAGYDDCNSTYGDGCEADLNTETDNCGLCARLCDTPNATSACNSGVCEISSCTAPWSDCNGLYGDGCESDISSSTSHCGACDDACAADNAAPECVSGQCRIAICVSGYEDCDRDVTNGCEVDLRSDGDNCGSCGTGAATQPYV